MKLTMKLTVIQPTQYWFDMFPKQGTQIYLNSYTSEWVRRVKHYDFSNCYVKRFHERFFK